MNPLSVHGCFPTENLSSGFSTSPIFRTCTLPLKSFLKISSQYFPHGHDPRGRGFVLNFSWACVHFYAITFVFHPHSAFFVSLFILLHKKNGKEGRWKVFQCLENGAGDCNHGRGTLPNCKLSPSPAQLPLCFTRKLGGKAIAIYKMLRLQGEFHWGLDMQQYHAAFLLSNHWKGSVERLRGETP